MSNEDIVDVSLTDEDLESDPIPQKEKCPGSIIGYRILSVVLFLLAAGGLFLGLLGQVANVFAHQGVFQSDGTLGGSLIGYIIDMSKSAQEIFAGLTNLGLTGMVNVFVVYALAGVLAVSVLACLISMIVALLSRKAAKRSMHASAVFLFVAYGGLFLYALIRETLGTGYTLNVIDVPTLIIAGIALIILIATALAERKSMGLLNVLVSVLSYACIVLFFWGDLALLPIQALSEFTTDLFLSISALLAVVVFLINFYASSIRFCAKKAYAFDIIRLMLAFVAVALTAVSYVLALGNDWNLLLNTFIIATIAVALVALVLSIVAATVNARRIKRERAAETEVSEEEEEEYESEEEEEEEETAAIPEPAAPVVSAVPAPVEEAVPAPVEEAVPVRAVPAPPAEEPRTEFERRMAALARGEEPKPAEEHAATYPAYAPVYQRSAAQTQDQYSQYTYDPFLNTLTPAQKNEFGDLFIGGKYGALNYLPAYIIGGDNTEFFRKIFIYLGRFRSHISRDLLDKIYQFVTTYIVK